ncbi:MAG TPA: hypothetical protein VF296_02910 [Gallionella sp.]
MEIKEERNATAIGYASLMLAATWQAARTEGEEKSPEVLAEIEKRIEAGTAMLAISIQRIGGTVRLTAAVLEANGFQDTFDHLSLDITGPLIVSREQMARLIAIKPGDLN